MEHAPSTTRRSSAFGNFRTMSPSLTSGIGLTPSTSSLRIKRLPSEVTGELLSQVITKINDERREKKRKEHIDKTGAPPGISGDLWHRLGKADINPDSWDFGEKSKWMFTYLMSRLNTDLHTKTVSVENNHGLEVYCQICNILDAVPENLKFFLDSQFTALPQVYGEKIKGLKGLHNFRPMLKAKVVAYKRAIGHEPDLEHLKQVLYVCMDMASKNLASQSGLDRKGYADLCDDIDRRYRLQYEALDVGKSAKLDDSMGLSHINLGEDEPGAESQAQAEPERGPI